MCSQKNYEHRRLSRKAYNVLNRCLLVDGHFLALSPRQLDEVVREINLIYHGYVSQKRYICLMAAACKALLYVSNFQTHEMDKRLSGLSDSDQSVGAAFRCQFSSSQ